MFHFRHALINVCAGMLLTSTALVAELNSINPTVLAVNSAILSAPAELENDQFDIVKLSQSFGNFIGKNINNPGIKFDLESLILGIREGAEGKPAPLSEVEYEAMLTAMQEKAFMSVATTNLDKANAFLLENAKNPVVVALEAGKLQYEVLHAGNGQEVKEHTSPQLHYTGKFIDGSVFGTSEGMENPITIPLDQTIPGFSKGLVGMKEGEKRRLYIHPDLAYGMSGQLPPNELLIFEIELVKSDTVSPIEELLLGESKETLEQLLEDEVVISEEAASEATEQVQAILSNDKAVEQQETLAEIHS